MSEGSTKQQFNIYLPADLVRRVKHAAVDSDTSLSVYVERVLEEHLRRAAGPASRKGDES
jgi:predicted HicB family RNase H-like nuclease